MNLDRVSNLIMVSILLAVIISAIRLLRSKKHFLTVVYFIFAVSCGLLSVLYWGAYTYLRPETRMPFAANEICEWAEFLLYASSLRAVFHKSISFEKKNIPVVLFAVSNVCLWIAWSGEWVQDILTGLSMGWFLCVITTCLCLTCALSAAEWIGLGIVAVLLILGQMHTFFTPSSISAALDVGCSVLLFVVMLWIMLKAVLTLDEENQADKCMCLSYASLVWGTVFMYMSSGGVYVIALALTVLSYVLMLLAIKKEVAEG